MVAKTRTGPADDLRAYSRLVVNTIFQRDPTWLFKPGKELFAVRRGRKVVVKSRTRASLYHVVDVEKQTCTCEAGKRGIRCWHLEAAEYSEVLA